jgi:hypothetical protein
MISPFGPKILATRSVSALRQVERPRIVFSVRRSTKEGIDVLPDNRSVSGEFEKASEGSLID